MRKDKSGYPSAADLCRKYKLKANKNFGQNFLDNRESIERMLSVFSLNEEAYVLEIGPGLGHTSQAILERGAYLSAIEIDSAFKPALDDLGAKYPKFKVYYADARNKAWSSIFPADVKIYVIANLPYYLSTELFTKALLDLPNAEGMSFLLQREVAIKFSSKPSSRDYGPPAILAQVYGEVSLGQRIAAGSFYPPPRIESQTIILMKHQEKKLAEEKFPDFYHFLKILFSSRRKTMLNNLSLHLKKDPAKILEIKEQALASKLDLSLRAEDVQADKLLYIFKTLYNLI